MEFTLYIIPVLLFVLFVYAHFKKINAYESFVRGCREGLKIVYDIMPFVISMILATQVFRSSGVLETLTNLIPNISFNLDLVSLMIFKPISGMASNIVLNDIFKNYGPDSFIGTLASVISGSTDTLLYIVTVYFGAIGIQNVRHSIKVGLLTEAFSFIIALFVVLFAYQFL